MKRLLQKPITREWFERRIVSEGDLSISVRGDVDVVIRAAPARKLSLKERAARGTFHNDE